MGNTPNRALPYPEDTDPLANMAAAIEALATALDQPRKACSVRRSVAQAIPDNTITAITFDTEVYDTDTMFAASSAIVTVRTAGLWHVIAGGGFAAGTSGRRFVAVRVNGAEVRRVEPSASGASWCQMAPWVGRLAVNDQLSLVMFQISGGALNTSGTGALAPGLDATWVGP